MIEQTTSTPSLRNDPLYTPSKAKIHWDTAKRIMSLATPLLLLLPNRLYGIPAIAGLGGIWLLGDAILYHYPSNEKGYADLPTKTLFEKMTDLLTLGSAVFILLPPGVSMIGMGLGVTILLCTMENNFPYDPSLLGYPTMDINESSQTNEEPTAAKESPSKEQTEEQQSPPQVYQYHTEDDINRSYHRSYIAQSIAGAAAIQMIVQLIPLFYSPGLLMQPVAFSFPVHFLPLGAIALIANKVAIDEPVYGVPTDSITPTLADTAFVKWIQRGVGAAIPSVETPTPLEK